MDALKLRFNDNGTELPLGPGMHGIGRGGDDAIGLVSDQQSPLLRFCVDRRGVWLTVADGVRGIHVNGRPVRRMAMLRPGDAIHAEGSELTLMRDEAPANSPLPNVADTPGDLRLVLRGVGGHYHGRSITLERPRLVGRAPEADIRIDNQAFPERHARLEHHAGRVLLRDLDSGEASAVNGKPVRDALLLPGDQVVFDAQHRFVVEAPGRQPLPEDAPETDLASTRLGKDRSRSRGRRLPWLLLAALLIAGALSLLLLFGVG
uniref:FHA domain-containing protein n=1 Tax=Pseudoluteimonas lycopersici TaxID=1324796 RepID=UPI001FEC536B|nr:FHA domain-containing protein [Lysobacter lycopersici]